MAEVLVVVTAEGLNYATVQLHATQLGHQLVHLGDQVRGALERADDVDAAPFGVALHAPLGARVAVQQAQRLGAPRLHGTNDHGAAQVHEVLAHHHQVEVLAAGLVEGRAAVHLGAHLPALPLDQPSQLLDEALVAVHEQHARPVVGHRPHGDVVIDVPRHLQQDAEGLVQHGADLGEDARVALLDAVAAHGHGHALLQVVHLLGLLEHHVHGALAEGVDGELERAPHGDHHDGGLRAALADEAHQVEARAGALDVHVHQRRGEELAHHVVARVRDGLDRGAHVAFALEEALHAVAVGGGAVHDQQLVAVGHAGPLSA